MRSAEFPALPSLRPKPAGDSVPECCALCRHWATDQQQATPSQGNVSTCRRYPPTTALAPNPRPLPGQAPVMPVQLPQPMTPALLWCGEFSRPDLP